MTAPAEGPRKGRIDPLAGPVLAILSLLYFLYLFWLLAGGGAGLPTWLIALTMLPLIAALAAYAAAVILEFMQVYRSRRAPPPAPGDGERTTDARAD